MSRIWHASRSCISIYMRRRRNRHVYVIVVHCVPNGGRKCRECFGRSRMRTAGHIAEKVDRIVLAHRRCRRSRRLSRLSRLG